MEELDEAILIVLKEHAPEGLSLQVLMWELTVRGLINDKTNEYVVKERVWRLMDQGKTELTLQRLLRAT